MKPDLIIVGAGLTGLTAAIEAAERGWRVTVAEAHARPGGRARSLAAPFRANTGPHAIYVDGPWWAWLERHGLTPPIVEAPRDASLVRAAGRLGPWPAQLSEAIAALPTEAQAEFVKKLAGLLEHENVAYDIAGHRDAPPGLRIWTGATVERDDVAALLPWLDWAYGELRRAVAA